MNICFFIQWKELICHLLPYSIYILFIEQTQGLWCMLVYDHYIQYYSVADDCEVNKLFHDLHSDGVEKCLSCGFISSSYISEAMYHAGYWRLDRKDASKLPACKQMTYMYANVNT